MVSTNSSDLNGEQMSRVSLIERINTEKTPEAWWAYLQSEKQKLTLSDQGRCRLQLEKLESLFKEAISDLTPYHHWRDNDVFVNIWLDLIEFRMNLFNVESDIRSLFESLDREAIGQKVARLYVDRSLFEARCGHTAKACDILNSGKSNGAQPTDAIEAELVKYDPKRSSDLASTSRHGLLSTILEGSDLNHKGRTVHFTEHKLSSSQPTRSNPSFSQPTKIRKSFRLLNSGLAERVPVRDADENLSPHAGTNDVKSEGNHITSVATAVTPSPLVCVRLEAKNGEVSGLQCVQAHKSLDFRTESNYGNTPVLLSSTSDRRVIVEKTSSSSPSLTSFSSNYDKDSNGSCGAIPYARVRENAMTTKKDKRIITVQDKEFRRLHLIGKGGTSKVFMVMADDGQLFALKRIKSTNMAEHENEIRTLQKLSQVQSVAKLYRSEYKKEEGVLLMVLEYGECDLARKLQVLKQQADSENFIRWTWEQMLVAVESIHANSVVHTDLKPANFLYVQGVLKLIDFGLASQIPNDHTAIMRDEVQGTFNYISPEAICQTGNHQKKKIGRPSDIWSLGCILYQLAYGKAPFFNISNLMEKIRAITDDSVSISFPHHQNHNLVEVLRMCLRRDPKQRPTIAELRKHPFLHP